MRSSFSNFFFSNFKKLITICLLLPLTFYDANSENLKTETVIELQSILKKISRKDNSLFFQSTLKAIKSLYDAEKMIQMILGDYWDMISEEEKEELTQVFEQYITSNYLKMFRNIENPNFKYINEKKLVKIID